MEQEKRSPKVPSKKRPQILTNKAHNIFYNTFTIMLSSMLLQPVIDGKKNNYSDIFKEKKKKQLKT